MDNWLLDTNVLLRMQEKGPGHHPVAARAIALLAKRGACLYVTPQVLVEYWCSATRPVEANGLGWDTSTIAGRMSVLLARFRLLEDTSAVFDIWQDLVERYDIKGKKVHDARLVAVMQAHGVQNLLTFNTDDFAAFGEIKAVHPANVRQS